MTGGGGGAQRIYIYIYICDRYPILNQRGRGSVWNPFIRSFKTISTGSQLNACIHPSIRLVQSPRSADIETSYNPEPMTASLSRKDGSYPLPYLISVIPPIRPPVIITVSRADFIWTVRILLLLLLLLLIDQGGQESLPEVALRWHLRLLLLLQHNSITHPAFNLRRARASAGHQLLFNSMPAGRYAGITHRAVHLRWHTVCHSRPDARVARRSIYFGNCRRQGWFKIALLLIWLAWPRGKEAGVCCTEAWITCAS